MESLASCRYQAITLIHAITLINVVTITGVRALYKREENSRLGGCSPAHAVPALITFRFGGRMKLPFHTPSLLASLLVLVVLQVGQMRPAAAAPKKHSLNKSSVGADLRSQYGSLPLSFEKNVGQAQEGVEFLARGANYTAFLRADEMELALSRPHLPESNGSSTVVRGETGRSDGAVSVLQINFAGAASGNGLQGLQELPGKVNYFLGNNPAHWHSDVPTFERIENKNLYPGIGLQYHSNRGELEYDFLVSPRANADAIRLRLPGASKLRPTAGGDLVVEIDGGELRLKKPVAYQEQSGTRKLVEAGYVVNGGNQVTFRLAAYDHRRTIVIDPQLSYSTYLGGTVDDGATAIALDGERNAYVTGFTNSPNFPVTPGVVQPVSCKCAFVAKINAAGTGLVYSTFLGGGNDEGFGIAVDSSGNAYVTGDTSFASFPTTASAFQSANGGDRDAFLSKLDPSGSTLLYSSYLGGNAVDQGNAVAVDDSGNAYVGGLSFLGPVSTDTFPTTPGAFQTAFGGGSQDGWIAHFDTTKSGAASLVYSTFLGGGQVDSVTDIAVREGRVYATGATESTDFPVTPGAFQKTCFAVAAGVCAEAFVTQLSHDGSKLIYSTYLGGSGTDDGNGIALDLEGNAYITGDTSSKDLPLKKPLQTTNHGGGNGEDAFVTKLNPTGSALIYSTYLGGSGDEVGFGIAVDKFGNAYVTGLTYSTDFPTKLPIQAANAGAIDVFVSKLNEAGNHLAFSTYLGGAQNDLGLRIRVDSCRAAYVAGESSSSNFPTTPGAVQTTSGGGRAAFVTKIRILPCP